MFSGPITPQGTGLLAVESVAGTQVYGHVSTERFFEKYKIIKMFDKLVQER